MVSTPLSVVMTTGLAALALLTSLPPTVTLLMPASANTVTEPVTVAPEASATLLWPAVTSPSLSSGVITGGASVWPVTVMVRVAVLVAPCASDTVYVIDVVAVWPSFKYWNAVPGLNVYVPSAFSVNVPPFEPTTGLPTSASTPLTCETWILSPSGSLSLPSTPSVTWLTTRGLSSPVVP